MTSIDRATFLRRAGGAAAVAALAGAGVLGVVGPSLCLQT